MWNGFIGDEDGVEEVTQINSQGKLGMGPERTPN